MHENERKGERTLIWQNISIFNFMLIHQPWGELSISVCQLSRDRVMVTYSRNFWEDKIHHPRDFNYSFSNL